jgi:hypothetical protein
MFLVELFGHIGKVVLKSVVQSPADNLVDKRLASSRKTNTSAKAQRQTKDAKKGKLQLIGQVPGGKQQDKTG